MISIDGLTKIFRLNKKDITAVDHLSLSIEDGEIFGVIGYSGAGKSTFIRLLNRLEEPTSGKVTIQGKEITSMKKSELRVARQDIGMVFQHFNLLWSRTVSENIAFPLEIAGVPAEERVRRVKELIDLVGLTGRENSYPSQLSGGQKQRVGIARALANKPKVLLCDEATSALDPETTNSILELLVNINKKLGLTIILITHEMHVIRKICNRVAVMEDGKIVEQGDVLNVFLRPEQDVTKKFVKQVMSSSDEEELENFLVHYTGGKLVELTFVGESTNQALISTISKKFEIEVNILQGKITQTQRGAYGKLTVQLQGEDAEIARAISFIENETSVQLEVIQHAN
ncbi:methionine ABC transporter ATP-binding protein [Ornithinibacillus bavariensis]|uniref:Methionine import ATP-binding protein MetN 3 n=1 Tax=Ornithinibacillus bavariensis TaxID=545502 RepID=A0A920C762_9BACI|nr:methionine ABC transporter ATP-binding protein [Ornithinibacillus bavariensis]GIO28661.1 methionine import ATP-binding protein MetN 3 [Ornithinibacillus bavariensis]